MEHTKLRPCTFVCALGYAGIPDNTFLRIPVIRCLWPAASKLNSEGGMPSLRITRVLVLEYADLPGGVLGCALQDSYFILVICAAPVSA